MIHANQPHIWYHVSNNFGDGPLARYLCEKITGRPPVYAAIDQEHTKYIINGSVLNWAECNTIAWGCGIATLTDKVDPKADIRSVRGPISWARARSCGIDNAPQIYGDSAMVLPRLYSPIVEKEYKLGIIPHYVDQPGVQRHYAKNRKLLIVDVFDPIETIIDQICSCEYVISSSLHGLVVAHAYGIPAKWVVFSDSVLGDGTKFLDHLLSLELDPAPALDLREGEADLKSIVKQIPSCDHEFDDSALWDSCPLRNL